MATPEPPILAGWEIDEIDRANASGLTPVLFVADLAFAFITRFVPV
jgi:hypothetical protein